MKNTKKVNSAISKQFLVGKYMTDLKSSDEYYRNVVAKKSEAKKLSLHGIYQFRPIEFGYAKYTSVYGRNKWTGKYGIKSSKDFEASLLVQEIAFRESLSRIWEELKDYHHYQGQNIKGITITKSGMLTAAFYLDRRYLESFLNTSGAKDIRDKSKMRCSDYLQEFGGYDIDYSVTELIQKRYEELESNKPEDKTKLIISSLESLDSLCKPEDKKKLIIALKIELFEKFATSMSKYTINSSQEAHQKIIELTNKPGVTPEITGQIIEQGYSEVERIFKRKLLKFVATFGNTNLAVNIATNDKLKDEAAIIAKKLNLREILGYLQRSLKEEEIEILQKINKLLQRVKFKEILEDILEFIKKEDLEIAQKLKALALKPELIDMTGDLKKDIVQIIIHEVEQTKTNLNNCEKMLIKGCIEINRYDRDGRKDFMSLVDTIEYGRQEWEESVGIIKDEQQENLIPMIGFCEQYY